MKVSNNFNIEEFVDETTYNKFRSNSIWFIDPRVIKIAQALRNHFGAITINNWMSGGNREWSGLRTNKSSYYSSYSQHTFGRAIDMLFKDYTAAEIRYKIKENEHYWFELGIRAIEENVNWVHVDVRDTKLDHIKWFSV